jgi:hypothetical protein
MPSTKLCLRSSTTQQAVCRQGQAALVPPMPARPRREQRSRGPGWDSLPDDILKAVTARCDAWGTAVSGNHGPLLHSAPPQQSIMSTRGHHHGGNDQPRALTRRFVGPRPDRTVVALASPGPSHAVLPAPGRTEPSRRAPRQRHLPAHPPHRWAQTTLRAPGGRLDCLDLQTVRLVCKEWRRSCSLPAQLVPYTFSVQHLAASFPTVSCLLLSSPLCIRDVTSVSITQLAVLPQLASLCLDGWRCGCWIRRMVGPL